MRIYVLKMVWLYLMVPRLITEVVIEFFVGKKLCAMGRQIGMFIDELGNS